MAGFGSDMNPLYRIKLAVIGVYAVALLATFRDKETKYDPGIRTILWLWTVYFLALMFYDNTKDVKYAVHILPLFDAMLAIWIVKWWALRAFRRIAAASAGLVFVPISAGGLVYTCFVQDSYQRYYLPTADFLRHRATRGDLILAGSEFGFALGFDSNLVDDNEFTYYSRKVPVFIVMSRGYRGFLDHLRTARPNVYWYVEQMLGRHYRLVYDNPEYEVYERNRGG
jgi:hypothetical protein